MFRPLIVIIALCAGGSLTTLGQSVPPQIEAANKKISAAMQKKDYKAAADYAREAVAVVESHYGADSRHTAISYENLGTLLAADGKHKQAVEPLQKALAIFRKDLKANSADATNILSKLGEARVKAGQAKEAEATYLEYRDGALSQFGAGSRETLQAKLALSCFYQRSREDTKAMDELVEAYALALTTFGRDSAELDQTAAACEGTAMNLFWSNQKRLDPARKRLNDLLGYQMGKPTIVSHADVTQPIPWKRTDVIAHHVVVKVWIDEKGNPTNAKLVFGGEKFKDLAVSGAKGSRYTPSVKDGKPIGDVFYYPYSFIR